MTHLIDNISFNTFCILRILHSEYHFSFVKPFIMLFLPATEYREAYVS